MIIPINARSAGAAKRLPIVMKVDGSATIIPAPFKPKNAKKKEVFLLIGY